MDLDLCYDRLFRRGSVIFRIKAYRHSQRDAMNGDANAFGQKMQGLVERTAFISITAITGMLAEQEGAREGRE